MDRNIVLVDAVAVQAGSLSARRAWIEIAVLASCALRVAVALRKESVDRNNSAGSLKRRSNGRSPQGERG